jgi:entericidin B
MLKRTIILLIAIGALGALTGCNTMEGAGKDIERGGESVQDKANRNR